MKEFFALFTALAVATLLLNCGGSSSGALTTSTSGFGSAAIGSPFATSTSNIVVRGAEAPPVTFAQKKAALAKLFTATDKAQCKFLVDLKHGATNAACYGPVLELTGTHPNGAMASPYFLPPGDVGIWNETNGPNQEACTAAQINALIDGHGSDAFFSQLLAATVHCYANNTAVGFPETLDDVVTLNESQVGELKTISGINLTAGSITRIKNSAEDLGYKYSVAGSVTAGPKTVQFDIAVQFVPKSDDVFSGTVAYLMRTETDVGGHCDAGGGPNNITRAGYGIFKKESASANSNIVLDTGTFCGHTHPAAPGPINPCDITLNDPGAQDGWGNNWNHLIFDFSPSTLVGKYAYAWQAGFGDGNTRVFNAEISDEDSGVGYFGFGNPVNTTNLRSNCQVETNPTRISKMICNWAGPGNTHTGITKIQMQTMKKESGVWKVDTAKNLRYAPTNTCSTAGSLGYFAVNNQNDRTALTHTNDNAAEAASLQDLLDVSTYEAAFTQPSAPEF